MAGGGTGGGGQISLEPRTPWESRHGKQFRPRNHTRCRPVIALVRNPTEGINLVAKGFPRPPGDNWVTLADEVPSNQCPRMHLADRGVRTRRVPTKEGEVDLDRLAAACDRPSR